MVKRILRDIAEPERHRRSIQDIRREDVSTRRPIRRPRPAVEDGTHEILSMDGDNGNADDSQAPQIQHDGLQKHFEEEDKGDSSRYFAWAGVIGGIALLFIVVSTVLSGARITIVPMQAVSDLNTTLTAYQNPPEGKLSFRLIEISDSATKEVPATEENFVERKASGQIIVYNAYSDSRQRLIKNTRFETPDGKIYRIPTSVTVPGTTVKEGKIVPGSVEVTVYADVPGDEYNVGLTDFTIPGFTGDSRFDKFYARSKSEMTRGFSGTVKTVSKNELTEIDTELRTELEKRLNTQVVARVLDDFIVYGDGTIINIGSAEPEEQSASDSATVSINGTIYAVIFSRAELSSAIAKEALSSYDGSEVSVSNLDELSFSMVDKGAFIPAEDNEVSFTISGTPRIVWVVDEDGIKTSLAGNPKAEFPSVVEKYVSIKKAEAKIRPFWKGSFPDDIKKLTIDIVSG